MFLLQRLEDGKDLHFPSDKKEVKHFRSLTDYYRGIGVEI